MNIQANLDTLRELELLSALPPDWLAEAAQVSRPATATPAPREAPQAATSRAPLLQPPPPLQKAPAIAAVPVAPVDPARVARIAALDWNALIADAASCQACRLCEKRKQAVPGVGARDAPWLFVGEGPGADEDEQGEPFVGQAGKLLDAMLAATGLQRGREVYIANVVKCRPPGNRTPSLDEAEACAPYLDRQIALIQPKIIVALGKTAVTRLTGRDTSMASLRQQRFEYQGIPMVATYHPAYLLRNLPDKLKAWEDLVFARRVLAGHK
ncbi:MAG: uracil-DNA glycosylase [Betaproteobacteria bacterium]|nr:uracil-DNA glycosylase [Betaproteobacteria bacterium]